MGAFEEFTDLIRQTATMQALLDSLEKEPAKLLTAVCREYEVTTEAVPDHHLNLLGILARQC
jgi:hypothetical protein